MSHASTYAALALIAGLGIPVMVALNATLGAQLGSPAAATVILFLVALAVSVGVLLLLGPDGQTLRNHQRHLLLPAVCSLPSTC